MTRGSANPSPNPNPNPIPNPNPKPNPNQGDKAERAPREEDESLRKQNCYSLAIELLKAILNLTRTLP